MNNYVMQVFMAATDSMEQTWPSLHTETVRDQMYMAQDEQILVARPARFTSRGDMVFDQAWFDYERARQGIFRSDPRVGREGWNGSKDSETLV